MFYFLIIISLLCGTAKANDVPVYADVSGVVLDAGTAPMGVNEGETLQDMLHIGDVYIWWFCHFARQKT